MKENRIVPDIIKSLINKKRLDFKKSKSNKAMAARS